MSVHSLVPRPLLRAREKEEGPGDEASQYSAPFRQRCMYMHIAYRLPYVHTYTCIIVVKSSNVTPMGNICIHAWLRVTHSQS